MTPSTLTPRVKGVSPRPVSFRLGRDGRRACRRLGCRPEALMAAAVTYFLGAAEAYQHDLLAQHHGDRAARLGALAEREGT